MAKVIKLPQLVNYFGPRPSWLNPGTPMYLLATDGVYEATDGTVVTVPRGYVTDFASVPKPVWWLIPPHGQLSVAAVPHDWGYSHGGINPYLAKKWWDQLFGDLLKITPGISAWKAPLAYQAVRFGGKGGWKNGFYDFNPAVSALELG